MGLDGYTRYSKIITPIIFTDFIFINSSSPIKIKYNINNLCKYYKHLILEYLISQVINYSS